MSKSLGTGVDPINLIEKYGADATRFGIAYQIMGGQDIKFVEDNIIMGRKFCNKLWNASRFVLLQTQNKTKICKRPIRRSISFSLPLFFSAVFYFFLGSFSFFSFFSWSQITQIDQKNHKKN